jgi:diacylglycerol kinase
MSDLTLRARLRSISFAVEGLRVLLSTQANAKIHLVASCVS